MIRTLINYIPIVQAIDKSTAILAEIKNVCSYRKLRGEM